MVNYEQAEFINRLVASAQRDATVRQLLHILNDTVLIDGVGNKLITGEREQIEMLEAAADAHLFFAASE
jgi:hypothetical protein